MQPAAGKAEREQRANSVISRVLSHRHGTPNNILGVAEHNDAIVGFFFCKVMSSHWAMLDNFYLLPEKTKSDNSNYFILYLDAILSFFENEFDSFGGKISETLKLIEISGKEFDSPVARPSKIFRLVRSSVCFSYL